MLIPFIPLPEHGRVLKYFSSSMSMFPIRCVVEVTFDGRCVNCYTGDAGGAMTLVDSFAIVAGQTPLSQLVGTVLTALGLPHLLPGAKGMIQLKNWKPLPFEVLTDEPDIEIENLLKDVSNQSVLKIVTTRRTDTNDCVKEMKDRLLKATIQKVPSVLTDIREPHLKEFVTQLVQSNDQQRPVAAEQPTLDLFNAWLDSWSRNDVKLPLKRHNVLETHHHQQTTTRFSQLLEVPKLERWFKENSNPSRQKLIHYMYLLNGSNFRKHTAKISYQQICNWFSNARASSRRRSGYVRKLPAVSEGDRDDDTIADRSTVSDRTSTNSKVGSVVSSATAAFSDFLQPNNDGNYASVIISCSSAVVKRTTSTSNDDLGTQQNEDIRCSSTSDDTVSCTVKEPIDEDSKLVTTPVYNNGIRSATVLSETCSSPPASASPLKSLTDSLAPVAGSVIRCSSSLPAGYSSSNLSRTRLMFDPLTELPILEKWFDENPHPSWIQIDQYTDTLNGMLYRRTYPSVSSHNVKIWFKNRRAKCKRRALCSD